MSNFQLKGSKYDFDHILENRGYKISHDYEDRTVFSKPIDIKSNHAINFRDSELKEMAITVTRPKILNGENNYDVYSPYAFSFNYFVVPHHAIRRMRWDTFPGGIPDVFESMIDLVEDEAGICLDTFMETDSLIINSQKTQKTQEKNA